MSLRLFPHFCLLGIYCFAGGRKSGEIPMTTFLFLTLNARLWPKEQKQRNNKSFLCVGVWNGHIGAASSSPVYSCHPCKMPAHYVYRDKLCEQKTEVCRGVFWVSTGQLKWHSRERIPRSQGRFLMDVTAEEGLQRCSSFHCKLGSAWLLVLRVLPWRCEK